MRTIPMADDDADDRLLTQEAIDELQLRDDLRLLGRYWLEVVELPDGR